MRSGLVGFLSALALASVATGGCSSGGSSTTGGTGGSSSGGTGGGGGGAATPVTTLNGSTALSALTPAQRTQLCSDTAVYFGALVPMATTCKWRGLAYAASSSAPTQDLLQQKCTMQESNCSQAGNPWANNFGCDIAATCAATVAEYSACIHDEIAAFLQAVNALPTCATLMMSNSSTIIADQNADLPASCVSRMNTCAELLVPNPLNLP